MSKEYTPFRFKQFTIRQQASAMKVGTDGVLLGAYASTNIQCPRILDVGCGCGLISLMMAQRYTNAQIIGIEIDKPSASEAALNTLQSPFADRVTIEQLDYNDYTSSLLFDLIVSNPPYYTSNNPSHQIRRSQATHVGTLTPHILFKKSHDLLTPLGQLSIITAISSFRSFYQAALSVGLYPYEVLYLRPTASSPAKRVISSYAKKQPSQCHIRTMIIEKARHQYTDEVKELTKDFYLEL